MSDDETSELRAEINIADPDGFYAELIEMTQGLDEEKAQLVNARLVLLLANQIGDRAVLRQAMTAARDGIVG